LKLLFIFNLIYCIASAKIAGVLKQNTEIMKTVNNLVKLPELQKTMMELQKEMMKVDKHSI